MRNVPIVPVGLDDAKLTQFLTNVVKVLKSAPDVQCYTVTVVWQVPYLLSVPTGQPSPRTAPPTVVRLSRAVLFAEPETPVEWGSGITWTWQGRDTVKIINQAGLVEGVKYELTFEVLG